MKKDTNDALERLQKELLAAEPEEDILEETMILSEPAFDDPDAIGDPEEPEIYRNFSNDYGKELEKEAEEAQMAKKKKNDKLLIGLMINACALCLGIMGILIYWWEAFMG